MRVLRPFIAVGLAFLWMPLAMHCELDAAGLWPLSQNADDSCCHHSDGCAHDACSVVKSGSYATNTALLKVSQPALLDCACAYYVRLIGLAPPTENVAWTKSPERPQDWVNNWYFVRRAACPPRAPSLNA